MKRFFTLVSAFLVCTLSNAQLVIYSGYNQQGSSATCVERTIYTDASIPSSLNNVIKSISLSQGFMATLAENADGSGESFCYMANVSNLNVNLANVLQNKVSFIRVLPLPIVVQKKGAGATRNGERDSLNVSWFYDWGRDDVSTTTQEYAPMLWGAYASIETSTNTVVNKTNVTNFMSFNEPDNSGQSGSSLTTTNPLTAIPYYKKMLRAGMRMVSPAPTENQYRVWLADFADEAAAQKLRIDVVAVHWYDWGNVCTNFTGCDLTMPIPGRTVDMNATNIFNRFKTWVNAVYALHQKPIWITEFNAHKLRSDAVQAAFMALALPWLDANTNVERYAYFFGNDVPTRSNGALTPAAQFYSNHASVNAYPANITDTRLSTIIPITLSDFQSKKVKDKVLLTWATQSEVNFSHFVLERSTDSKTFYEVAKVNASKMSAGSTYNYTDTPDATTTNYYRLKIVDMDGSFVYSKIVSEGYDASNTPLLVYPSLATQNKIETIFKTVSDAAQIKIFSITGQLLTTQNLKAGASSETINLSTFTEGVYFLVLQDKGTIQSRKFIKL